MDDSASLKLEIFRLKNLLAEKENQINVLKAKVPTTSLDGLVITDAKRPDFPIVFVNEAFEKITGYGLLDVVGKNCRLLRGTDREQPELQTLKKAIAEQKECRVVLRNYKKDGSIFWNELTIIPSFDNEHKLVSFAGLIHDITKEKEIDRMKTEFISLASHQLRTPLSAVRWFSELVKGEKVGALNAKQKEYLQYISSSTDRLIELVNSLLNVSRIESGRLMVSPQPTHLQEMLSTLEKDLYLQFLQKQIKYQCVIEPTVPTISVDPNLIRQVYMNLLTNAIKYTPAQGTVQVYIKLHNDSVISMVRDNGFGIPKKDQERIFQKFFRAENTAKKFPDGNGLGLYLVKAVIDISGGQIWFTSDEDKGTAFYFTLPLTGSQAKQGEVSLS